MKTLLLVLAVVLALSVTSLASGAESGIMGFQAWKTSRVDEAKTNLEKLQGEILGDKPSAIVAGKEAKPTPIQTPTSSKPGRSDQKLEQAKLNVELANDLSVQDYFVLYLNQFKTRDAFLEAAKKLSPEETAELMLSYKKQLDGGDSEAVPSMLNGTTSPGPKSLRQ